MRAWPQQPMRLWPPALEMAWGADGLRTSDGPASCRLHFVFSPAPVSMIRRCTYERAQLNSPLPHEPHRAARPRRRPAGVPRALLGHKVAVLGLRPPLPPFSPPDFRDLVEACWAHEPDKRWALCVRACAQARLPARTLCAPAFSRVYTARTRARRVRLPACTFASTRARDPATLALAIYTGPGTP